MMRGTGDRVVWHGHGLRTCTAAVFPDLLRHRADDTQAERWHVTHNAIGRGLCPPIDPARPSLISRIDPMPVLIVEREGDR